MAPDGFPHHQVKQIKDHFGGREEGADVSVNVSVNDVLMTAASAALDRYNARLTAELSADDGVPTLPAHVKRRLRKASTSRLTLGVPFNVRNR